MPFIFLSVDSIVSVITFLRLEGKDRSVPFKPHVRLAVSVGDGDSNVVCAWGEGACDGCGTSECRDGEGRGGPPWRGGGEHGGPRDSRSLQSPSCSVGLG